MRLVVHKRHRRGSCYPRGEKDDVRGTLPSFIRPLGLDVIITQESQPVLIELQHGFGRRGLIRLFPSASRTYRKTLWRLRRERGKSPWIAEGLRRICSDKIVTYQHLSQYQPSSLSFKRWGSRVEAWLEQLTSRWVLIKPPRGSCGKGIIVMEREEISNISRFDGPTFLQEYVPSRLLEDEHGHAHLGCIRHIVLLTSEGIGLKIIHLPSYWRVSPEPLSFGNPAALTANISRGAYPIQVSAEDSHIVQQFTEEVCRDLISQILELPNLTLLPSKMIGE